MTERLGSKQLERAYDFLCEAESNNSSFTLEDLVRETKWASSSATSFLEKKVDHLIVRNGKDITIKGVCDLDRNSFYRMCSQKANQANDPRRPRLSPRTEELLQKAKEAALSAVQNYNNPNHGFRTANFLVMMNIAFNSLLHAIFERDSIDYILRDPTGTPKLFRGRPGWINLLDSANRYSKMHHACQKNLELLIPIMDDFEHRFMPDIDELLGGECQSMLTNFEEILVAEFTTFHSLGTSMPIALQFSTPKTKEAYKAIKSSHADDVERVHDTIRDFYAGLDPEILNDTHFTQKYWLIRKPANNLASSDKVMEYIDFRDVDKSQFDDLISRIVAIKSKSVSIDFSHTCPYYRDEIVYKLKGKLGDTVSWGSDTRRITVDLISRIVKAQDFSNTESFFYRPYHAGKHDGRLMLGDKFIEWIVQGYASDKQFLFKATSEKLPIPN